MTLRRQKHRPCLRRVKALWWVGVFGGWMVQGSGVAVDFVRDVKPILVERCSSCHGPLKQKGGLRLDAGALALKGGKHGPAVKPNDTAGSPLVARITSRDDDERMPPEGKPLDAHESGVLKAWIEQGARVPANEEIADRPEDHWFFQQPVKAEPPQSSFFLDFQREPIDRFISGEWQRRRLDPQALGDAPTRLRRVFLDLVGLPPSTADVEAFERDPSPAAYAAVVDRLLADPQHGVRWGRHFMDIWRYSDEVMDPCDGVTPMYGEYHLWRWRDWIIGSLNENKPYDRMVTEMLAGDELAPTEPGIVAGTGFIVRNFDGLNGRDAWLHTMVEHTSQAFLGLTLKCAKCHDHKYDPLSQKEFYQFRAVFEPIDRRLDFVAGFANPRTNGLPRIFDSDLDPATYLLKDGNAQTPDKASKLPPAVPAVLRAGELAFEQIDVPRTVSRPGTRDFVREDRLREARSQLGEAQEKVAAARKAADTGAIRAADAFDLAAYAAATNEPVLPALPLAATKLIREQARVRAAEALLQFVEASAAASEAADTDRSKAAEKKAHEAGWTWQRRDARVPVAAALREWAGSADEKKDEDDLRYHRNKVKTEREKLHKILASQAKGDDPEPLWKSYPEHSTGRRLGLARWITQTNNPATARVLVNHVWMRHFGQPLVDTVFDFGLHGAKPTHPALLDWLAVDFMEHGWDLRRLHRQIVLSRTYQLSSARLPGSVNERDDPENRFLWRMNSQRMQAEQVRDSILFVSGRLDSALGGAPQPPSRSDRVFRRSVFFRHDQDLGDAMLRMFDAPNPNECYRRSESVVPQQSLVLANSRLGFEHARIVAHDLDGSATSTEEFIGAAFRRTLGRRPSAEEVRLSQTFLDAAKQRAAEPDGKPVTEEKEPLVVAATDPALRARELFVQALFNHTDFITIR
jgi:hypothetical protein